MLGLIHLAKAARPTVRTPLPREAPDAAGLGIAPVRGTAAAAPAAKPAAGGKK